VKMDTNAETLLLALDRTTKRRLYGSGGFARVVRSGRSGCTGVSNVMADEMEG
jgi:hypothetical protein